MTEERPRFTVAIPTYNRGETVSRRVEEFLELALGPDVELLIVDNCSPDGTYEMLQSRFEDRSIRILKNDRNLGFAGNFFRLIEEARGEYLTVFSDEDFLHAEGFAELMRFCIRVSPDMVSPRAQAGENSRYRGRGTTRRIAPAEFEAASFYLSGLTFATDQARKSAAVVAPLVPASSAATVYPQVLVTALLVARGTGYFLDALVSSQREVRETAITESSGARYNEIQGRWAQFKSFEDFFAMDHSAILDPSGVESLAAMRDRIRAGILDLLVDAAIREAPVVAPYLRRRLRRRLGHRVATRLRLLLGR